MNYILITPVKDEEENLPKLAYSVLNQTILPKVWLIIDDGSKDRTPQIIKQLKSKFSWIHSKTLKEHPRDVDTHMGYLLKMGFEYTKNICYNNTINYEFLANADADIIFNKYCFEKLLKKFEEDNTLGIASPDMVDLDKTNYPGLNELFDTDIVHRNKYKFEPVLEPSNGLRIYRKTCFDEIGGIEEVDAPDIVPLIRAKIKGWKVKRFLDITAYKTRMTSSSIGGLWKGYILQGYRRYYLDYHPLVVILSTLYEVGRPPHYHALAMLYGYFISVFNKKKICDKDIRDYCRNKRLNEIKKNIINILKYKI